MSAKALSNGTLSLRFMQNAQRAKQQTQVHAEQAKINDDAEWHVSKDIQDAWGTTASSSSVTHEPSYLPFLFPAVRDESDLDDLSVLRRGFNGRRSFKKGKEVIGEELPVPEKEDLPQTTEAASVESGARKGKKPIAISGFKSASAFKPSTTALAARSLIRQDVDVGTDLRFARRQEPDHPSFHSPAFVDPRTGFVKPADVDAPPEAVSRPVTSSQMGSNQATTVESILQLEKSQTTTNSKKRDRDNSPVLGDLPTGITQTHASNNDASPKKRKRKKKTAVIPEG